MDKIKRHMAVNMPVIRACYSQDVTPQERRHNLEPIRTNRKSPHHGQVPGKGHPTIMRKVK